MKKILSLLLVFSVIVPSLLLSLPSEIFADDAKVITETTAGYTDSVAYGGGIVRTKSDGSIMMSPYLSQLKEMIDGGEKIDNYTVELTYTLLSGKNGEAVFTHDTVTAKLNASNGYYFDIYLNGTKGTTGYCPTAGKFYDIDINIYKDYDKASKTKVLYGTYKSAEVPTTITSSKYYKPSAIPTEPVKCNITVSYSFDNNLAGSAAGRISVSSDVAGEYGVAWGDKNGKLLTAVVGEKTLKYSSLYTLSIKKAGDTHMQKIIGFTAIPHGAKTLVVTDSNNNVLKSLELPDNKLLKEGAPNYSFGLISDVHFNYFFDSTKTVDYAEAAFDTALEFYKKAGANLIAATGDYSLYGEEESYKEFYNAVVESGMLVLACGGNHELYAKLDVMYGKNGYWRKYMNTGIYDGKVKGVLDIADNGIDFVYQIPGFTDSVFVSLSQWYWDGHTPAQEKLVEPEQLVWLEEQLEKYKDKTVYLLFHTYLSDDDYDTVDGQGDLTSKGGYTYGGHYNEYTEDEKTFRNLLTKYDNVIWFNGHSHYEYSMQMHNENVNIYSYQGTTATLVHVPSVTNPRTVAVNGTNYSSLAGSASQGGLQFVYDDYQIMNGIDLWNEEILSYACYIIYTDKDGISDNGTINNGEIEWTYDKQLSTLRFTGKGALEGVDAQNAPWAQYANGIKSIYIGNGITSIGKNLFNNLKNLEKVEIKEDVKTIGEGAFANTAISELVLPSNLTTIEKSAFGGINAISTITFTGTAEKWKNISVGEDNACLIGNVTYKSVKITFVNGDTTWVVDVNVGEIPQFNIIPYKEHEDDNKHYPFVGWSNGKKTYSINDNLPEAKSNITYTAVFGEEVDRYVTGVISTIKWTLDRATSTLTISGAGTIPDYEDYKKQPWYSYNSEIRTVVIKKGVKFIGKNSFCRMPVLSNVIIEEGVTTIKMDAFAYNDALTTLTLPSTLKVLGQGAVFNTNNINKINYSGTEDQWKSFCDGITTMYNEIIVKCKNVVYGGSEANCIHVPSNITGYTKANHWYICKICGENFDNAEHSFGDWVIIKPATEEAEGIKEHTCKCGYKETGVATLADNVVNEDSTTTPQGTTENPDTTNGSNVTMIIIIVASAVVVVAGILIVVLILRKKTVKK